jgi:cell division protein FtsZ
METSFPEVTREASFMSSDSREEEQVIHFELTPEITGPVQEPVKSVINEVPEALNFKLTEQSQSFVNQRETNNEQQETRNEHTFLAKPSNIYAQIPDQKPVAVNYEQTKPVQSEPLETTPAAKPVEEEPEFEMKLVEKEEDPGTADKARLQTRLDQSSTPAEEPAPLDDAEDQKRRAAERIFGTCLCPP